MAEPAHLPKVSVVPAQRRGTRKVTTVLEGLPVPLGSLFPGEDPLAQSIALRVLRGGSGMGRQRRQRLLPSTVILLGL